MCTVAGTSPLLLSVLLLALLAAPWPVSCLDTNGGGLAALAEAQLQQQTHADGGRSGSGRMLLQAAHEQQRQQQQQQQQQQAQPRNFDITIEEAILQTYTPGSEKGPRRQQAQEVEQARRRAAEEADREKQRGVAGDVTKPLSQSRRHKQQAPVPDTLQQQQQQQQQQAPGQGQAPGEQRQAPHPDAQHRQQQQQREHDAKAQALQREARARQLRHEQERQEREQQREQQERERRAREAKAAQEAEHSRLLERQRREAAAAGERLAAHREEERQQQSLGRGSLRSRKPLAVKPVPVTGSNKNDIFAQHMEKKLTAARVRLAEQHAQLAAAAAARAAAAAGSGGGAAGGGAAGAAAGGQQKAQGSQGRAAAAAAGSVAGGGAAGAGSGQAEHRRHQSIPLPIILIMTLAMAAAAGLGALPFFFVRSMSDTATGVATAIACGVMLAASFDLVHEGQPYGASLTVLGVLLGAWFIRWVQHQLAGYEDIQFGSLQGSSARKTVLMVGIMAAHALGEGCAVGVSFCGERGWAQGVLTTLAIGVHNIPEGLAKATVLVGQGVSPRRALAWSVATCLPQPLVAVPSFMFVEAFTMILPIALGFAAGCMVWMVFAELLPDALERADGAQVATAATVSAAGLEGFRMFFESLEQADGSFGGGAAAAHVAGVLSRMGGPLLVLLPAVAASAAGGGALGGSAIPPPVAWGVAAAVALSSGGGALLDQLLWRAEMPALHTLAAGAVGAALAVLLHRQLLHWADSSSASLAARKLHAMHKLQHGSGGGAAPAPAPSPAGPAGRSTPDVEALEYASMYQQHHLHHHTSKAHHHHTHPLPQLSMQRGGEQQGAGGAGGVAGPNGAAAAAGTYMNSTGGSINGFGGSSSSLMYQAPYHRGGAGHNGSSAALHDGSSQLTSGATTPSGFGLGGAATPVPRGGWRLALLPAPQLAAAATAGVALAASALTTGWHLACALLLLATDRSSALLPAAALLLAGPGLGAGALARTAPGRSGAAAGAWGAGATAALAALAAAVTAARAHESAHTAALVKHLLYPFGVTDTAEALAGGALCAAAWFCLAAGSALKPRSARGGLALGLAVTGLLAVLRLALCSTTPYCLSIHALLQR